MYKWAVFMLYGKTLTIDFEHALEILFRKIEECFDLCDTGIRYHSV